MKRTSFDGRVKDGCKMLFLIASLALLPPAIVLVDFHPSALAGCATYGYGCSQSACFTLEISTDLGYTWQRNLAWVYGPPGSWVNVYVRTTMDLNVGQIDGWSVAVKHDAPTLNAQNGGAFVLSAVGPGGGIASLKNGGPADFEGTRPWDCGQTQGVVVDFSRVVQMAAQSDFVTTEACYKLTFPTDSQVHTVTLSFQDVGDVEIENLVVQSATSLTPCLQALTLKVLPTTATLTPSYCPTLLIKKLSVCGGG